MLENTNQLAKTGSPPLDKILEQRWLKPGEVAEFILNWAEHGSVNLPEGDVITKGLLALLAKAEDMEVITANEALKIRDASIREFTREIKDPERILGLMQVRPLGWAEIAVAAATLLDNLERRPL